MQTTSRVAAAQPQSELDYMAYGQPSYSVPPSAVADSGGAISALRAGFAASPRGTYAPAQATYAAAPMPVAHDTPYKLDAGDTIRIGERWF